MQLKLRYQLMRKLYLQYLNGAEQAVDLFYTFSFD
jgi:autotransporter translocation and assembly factor TamB